MILHKELFICSNKTLVGNFLINSELVFAEVVFDKKIQNIHIIDKKRSNAPTILPGFIDLHVHGGGGFDFMEGEIGLSNILNTHAKHGTTSLLLTTTSDDFNNLKNHFAVFKNKILNQEKNESRILGIHLEGPFINPDKLGALPPITRKATLLEIDELNRISPIKIITLAPEIDENNLLITNLIENKYIVQIGHTNCSYEEAIDSLKKGATSFTHLYNAMTGLHHRSPGAVGAALTHATYSEIIPDLIHVHEGAIKIALKCIPNLYFVTDATAASGMPDGKYKLGTQFVHKCNGGVRLADGTLAGSSLTMDKAFLNLIKLGLSIEESSARLSKIPAQFINLIDRGEIKLNHFADFVLLNNDLTIKDVCLEGEFI